MPEEPYELTNAPGGIATPHAFIRELVETYGVSQADLVALSPQNDPWLTGRPTDITRAKWFASIYEEVGSPSAHLRDLHYQVIVRGLSRPDGEVYAGDGKDWELFMRAAGRARDLGLVSPFVFLDGRTRSEHAFDEYRERTEVVVFPASASLSLPDLDFEAWELPVPELEAPSPLALQPVVPEIWIEKDSPALFAEVEPIARRLGVRVVVGVGYQSETAAANVVRRAIDDGRIRLILWLADADAHGESMAIATARHAEFLCRHWLAVHEPETDVPRILCDRVALMLEQLAEVEASIGRSIPRSPDSGRDEGRVELQALAAFAPGWVAGELERRMSEIMDGDLVDEFDRWKIGAEAVIEAEWAAETQAAAKAVSMLSRIRDEVLERFDVAGLRAALRELEPELEAIQEELERLGDAFEPELPELPEGEVNLDQRDWMLDTARGYLDQLAAYRRHEPVHRRRPPLSLVERACVVCDGSLLGKKPGAMYCDRCRHTRGGRDGSCGHKSEEEEEEEETVTIRPEHIEGAFYTRVMLLAGVVETLAETDEFGPEDVKPHTRRLASAARSLGLAGIEDIPPRTPEMQLEFVQAVDALRAYLAEHGEWGHGPDDDGEDER